MFSLDINKGKEKVKIVLHRPVCRLISYFGYQQPRRNRILFTLGPLFMRQHVVFLIFRSLFLFSQDSKLSDVLKCHPDFLDRLALCLDRNMRLIPNWKQLARELDVDEDVIKTLEQHKDESPTIRLFEYLEVTQPQLTIQQLRNAMLDIRRNDLFSLLKTKGNIRTCF